MDGEAYAYDGKSGQWTCIFYPLQTAHGMSCRFAEITLRGELRCKVVLCRPVGGIAVELLRAKCKRWINQAEKRRA